MEFKLKGLVAATHTPFQPDGELAPEVVPVQAEYIASQKIDSVFITGSTGEGHSLTRQERVQMFNAWARAGQENGIKVVGHVGGNCIQDARFLASHAQNCGLDAIAALAPSYYKPSSVDDLIACCAEIAEGAPELPFYYYDIPVLTGVEFPMSEFLQKAKARIPNLAGIKYTNSDISSYRDALKESNDRFDLPWGVDEMLFDALESGAKGAVGSTYNLIAPLFHELINDYQAGRLDDARAKQKQAIEFVETVAEYGYLSASKAILGWRGIPVGPARLPISNPGPEQLDQLRTKLSSLGVLNTLLANPA